MTYPSQPRGRQNDLRVKLREADLLINGSVSERLQRERERLAEEENAYKERMDAIAGFRKSEIIPIGKLQRAIDESDSESEPLSETEETASANELARHGEIGPEPQQFDNSPDWNNPPETSQQLDPDPVPVDDLNAEVEDLDADVEDLDVDDDYSQTLDPGDTSGSRFDESYRSGADTSQ